MDHSEVKHLPKVDHTPAELDEASGLLLRTAAYLEEHGHCRGSALDERGGRCVIGAMTWVYPGQLLRDLTGTQAIARLQLAMERGITIPTWSDSTPTIK